MATETTGKGILTADIIITGGGTIYVLYPLTDFGRDWLDGNLQDGPRLGRDGHAVEHRYVWPIIEGALRDGLSVQHGPSGQYFTLRTE